MSKFTKILEKINLSEAETLDSIAKLSPLGALGVPPNSGYREKRFGGGYIPRSRMVSPRGPNLRKLPDEYTNYRFHRLNQANRVRALLNGMHIH